MKTSSHRQTKPRTQGVLAHAFLCIFAGLLLLIALPSVAFAAPAGGYTFGHSQALDRASVSVLRLVFTYTPGVAAKNVKCQEATGLGVIVDSSGTTSWLLTDGSLLVGSCNNGQNSASLNLNIFPSAAYTSAAPVSLATVSCVTPQGAIPSCSLPALATIFCQTSPCGNGAVLISFTTQKLQPFIDLSSSGSSSSQGVITPTSSSGTATSQRTTTPVVIPQGTGVGLTSSSAFSVTPQKFLTLPPIPAAQATAFLTPTAVQQGSGGEAGMPLIDNQGHLFGMQLNAAPDTTNIVSFITNNLHDLATASNDVHSGWDMAVSAFYAGQFTTASHDLKVATTANSAFQAPAIQAALALHSASGAPGVTATSTLARQTGLLGLPVSNELAFIGIAGLIILVLLLLVISLFVWRRRIAIRREQAEEMKRAEVIANRDAERIRKEEEAQNNRPSQGATTNSQPPFAPALAPVTPPVQQSPVLLTCPNCGSPVKPTDNFCQQCRAALNPSASGLHVRMAQPPQQSPVLSPDISSAETAEMAPAQMEQGMAQWQGSPDMERTQPRPPVQPAPQYGRFVVATRSNPGLKRKYKPNEDSLYAVIGNLTPASGFEDLGLFVVADGMGGHANGRDASTLAIQSIRERVLPKLQEEKPMPGDEYGLLLKDGVQSANTAVHQRNVEQRADMGTTMTAALVVNTFAYVANVGDSRTYLYRPTEGLKKITNDHSVVASLVTAGIINAEDVYTHPKRNQIYRSLGEKPDVEVDIFPLQLQPGDVLLLCCDGLWEMTRDKAIEDILRTTPDLAQAGDDLIQAAINGGGDDNITVVLVKVDEPHEVAAPTAGFKELATPNTPQYPPNGMPD